MSMLKEKYKLAKSLIEAEDVIFHDFATRLDIDGVSYGVVKWKCDYEVMTQTIEFKPLAKPKMA